MSRSAATKVQPRLETGHRSLTEQLWGVDWKSLLPQKISESVRVEILSFANAAPIIAQLFPEVYQTEGESVFGEKKPSPFKQKYYEIAGDFFVFYDGSAGDEVAGMAIGSVLDWSAYNFRNIAIAPAYQEAGLYFSFFELLSKVLKSHGVSRIEGDVAPSNRHHIHVLNKMGYIVTSVSHSERWGALLHVTKYLDEDEEERFTKLFSMTANSDLKANRRVSKKQGK